MWISTSAKTPAGSTPVTSSTACRNSRRTRRPPTPPRWPYPLTPLLPSLTHAFTNLRRGLEQGIILLGVQSDSLFDILTLVLNEQELKYGITSTQRNDIFRLFEDYSLHVAAGSKEGCKVFVTIVPSLTSPLFAVVRMRQPVTIGEDSVGIRYFLFVFGAGEQNSVEEWVRSGEMTSRRREMGRAFSMMFSQAWFGKAARKVNTSRLLLKVRPRESLHRS